MTDLTKIKDGPVQSWGRWNKKSCATQVKWRSQQCLISDTQQRERKDGKGSRPCNGLTKTRRGTDVPRMGGGKKQDATHAGRRDGGIEKTEVWNTRHTETGKKEARAKYQRSDRDAEKEG